MDPKELDLIGHIEELRTAVIRILVWLAVGTAIAWSVRSQLMSWLEYPAIEGARRGGLEDFSFHIFEPAGGILLMMQIALLGGTVLMFGFIVWELWRFVRHALSARERRYVYIVLPVSVLLFASGVSFCYIVTPAAFGFLIRFYVELGGEAQFILSSYLHFFMRLLLMFGLAFQTPLVLWFLAHLELVSSARLWATWRWAIVIIMLIAAIVTPTPDPFNMMLLAGPMMVLYFLSLGLVEMVERARSKRRRSEVSVMASPLQSPAALQAARTEAETDQHPDLEAEHVRLERLYAETGGMLPVEPQDDAGETGGEQP